MVSMTPRSLSDLAQRDRRRAMTKTAILIALVWIAVLALSYGVPARDTPQITTPSG
jgi:hypothetical protein